MPSMLLLGDNNGSIERSSNSFLMRKPRFLQHHPQIRLGKYIAGFGIDQKVQSIYRCGFGSSLIIIDNCIVDDKSAFVVQ